MYRLKLLLLIGLLVILSSCSNSKIDREALIKRHIPTLTEINKLSPFTVGNGEFAYTVGITGLQTFSEYYEDGIHLGTQSNWGWHSIPNENNYKLEDTFENYDTYGRKVPYAFKQHSSAGQWLRANPHRLHLGKVGFNIKKSDGTEIEISDLTSIKQLANTWDGVIQSSFKIENEKINVETVSHPDQDLIAVRIKSEMIKKGNIGITFDFPYGSLNWGNSTDWNSPTKHTSKILSQDNNSVVIERTLDTTKYFVNISWKGIAEFVQDSSHSFRLAITDGKQFEFVCEFSKTSPTSPLPSVEESIHAAQMHWYKFWKTGGAIDLSESKDPRALELERRIILSRYLTAIQCAGSLPPQETGLTMNSWYGKFHLEMHWWHAVQFALWGKPELFEKSLGWYNKILPAAKQKASRQGYTGARWPKMVSIDGRESPSTIGVFLIWQQPNPIYYSELFYRLSKNQETLNRYKNIVFETAEFMASYAKWDEKDKRYILGPPLIPAQEVYKPDTTMNATFELSYWRYGLQTAQKWRERLGLERVEKWDHIIKNLSQLPINNGLYQNAEIALNTFEDEIHRNDHPTLLGAFGMIPNDSIDIKVMRNTLTKVMKSWNWNRTWGWDYPMVAMTAARVGMPEVAIDALLMDVQKNRYLNNGHNYQDDNLPIYLPGNGGLLTAIAMMAAGWDGSENIHAPGFPQNGDWVVKFEDLKKIQ